MDPRFGLLSPSSHSISRAFLGKTQAPLANQDLSPLEIKKPFPSSGFAGDELLNLAHDKRIIGLNGRVQDDLLFNLKENLQEEIQAVAKRLQMADQQGEIFSNQPSYKAYSISFLNLIFKFQKLLGESTSPEIIGGAVSYLLGEGFFINYAVKRFQITEEEAKRLLEPVLRLVHKPPADIDCRQYMKTQKKMGLLDDAQFKARFSELLTMILVESTGNKYIDSRIIKNSYFQKLSLAKDETKRFGMGRFGKFLGGFPLEYLIVDQLPKPYISFHKSQAIEIHPPQHPGGAPRIGLKFYTKSLDSADILPETTIFQQIALILDANDLSGIDWRGFLSMMAEATRGSYRTLTPIFFNSLWENFKAAKVDLVEKMQWAAENHLLNRGGSPEGEKELVSLFYLNVCLYLIDCGEIEEDQVQILLKGCKALSEPLNFLLKILLKPGMDLKTKLAWFKIGMWLRLSERIPEGSLSTNYGTLCYRIVSMHALAAFWMPVDLHEACQLAIASLRGNEVGEEIFIQLLFISHAAEDEKSRSPYGLPAFNPWIDSTLAKELASALRAHPDNPNALRIALKIDLARCLSGVESMLPLEWLSVLPELFQHFPEEYPHFHHFFREEPHGEIQSVPKLEMILRKEEWIAYLIRSGKTDWVERGLKLSNQQMSPLIVEAIESHAMQIVEKKLDVHADAATFPWILFALGLGGGTKHCTLQSHKDKGLVLVYGHEKTSRMIPIKRTNLTAQALNLFKEPDQQMVCIQLFLKLFPNYAFEMKPLSMSGEDRKQLSQFARALLREESGSPAYLVGLKIFLILLKFEPSIPMAAEMLKYYPALHEMAPGAGAIIQAPLKSGSDQGSKQLENLLNGAAAFGVTTWTAALLSHNRKECLLLGEEIVKQLAPEEHTLVWNQLYPILLQYRLESIPRMMALFAQISISYKTYPDFFMQWIEKVRSLKNDKKNKELQEYLKKREADLLLHKELKNHKGSATDWLAKAKQAIKQLQEKPEIVVIEQLKIQLEEARKKRDALNGQEFADYFLGLEIPQMTRGDYDKLLEPKLGLIETTIPSKLVLYAKYQFLNRKAWEDLLAEIDEKQLWKSPVVKEFFLKMLSKEREYGSFFWKSEKENLVHPWFRLIVRYIEEEKLQIPLNELRRIFYEIYAPTDLQDPVLDSYDLLRTSYILSYSARLSFIKNISMDMRRASVEDFIRKCSEALSVDFDDLVYFYWQVNVFFWKTHGQQLIDALSQRDAFSRKIHMFAKAASLIFHADVDFDLSAALAVVEILKDNPAVSQKMQAFFEVLVSKPPKISGDIDSLTKRFKALFEYYHYDRFPMPHQMHSDLFFDPSAKFRIFERVLNGVADSSFSSFSIFHLYMSAFPPNGWLQFLQLYLNHLPSQVNMARFLKLSSGLQPTHPNMDDRAEFVRYATIIFQKCPHPFAEEELRVFLFCYYKSSLMEGIEKSSIPLTNVWNEIRQQLLVKAPLRFELLSPQARKLYLQDLMALFSTPNLSVDLPLLEKMIEFIIQGKEGILALKGVVKEWNGVVQRSSSKDMVSVQPRFEMLLSKLESFGKEIALKELRSSLQTQQPVGDWLIYLTRLLDELELAFKNGDHNVDALVNHFEDCLDVVSETCLSKDSLDEFRLFFERYYASKILQELRVERTHKRNILLFLLDIIRLPDESHLENYLYDLTMLFIDLSRLAPDQLPLEPSLMRSMFNEFIKSLCFSFHNHAIGDKLMKALIAVAPNPQWLEVPMLGMMQVALTMRVPIECYELNVLGNYLHTLIRSDNPIIVTRGLRWLSGALESLNEQLKFQEMETLLGSVFARENAPISFPMEPWMISQGLSEWLGVAVSCFNVFEQESVKASILRFLEPYWKLYEGIKELPENSQIGAYFILTTLLSELKAQGLKDKIPSSALLNYDQIVKQMLDKICLEYFPKRKQLMMLDWFQRKGFVSHIFSWSSVLISAMRYGAYESQDDCELKLRMAHELNQSYFTRLLDLAFFEGDRAFLESALKECKFFMGSSHNLANSMLFLDEIQTMIEMRLCRWESSAAKAFLKRIETESFSEEKERGAMARQAASIFLNWFQEAPKDLSQDEVSLYFKQFIQFLTQKLMDKSVSKEILKGVVENYPHPSILNFRPRSLNTVNMCIDAPVDDYIKNPEDLLNISRTLYRYIHSKDSFAVDTGFYWLGSLMTRLHPSKASEILFLVFDKGAAKAKRFESSNKGEILIEPWMAAYGLSHFLLNLVPNVHVQVAQEMRQLFKRYIALYKEIKCQSEEYQHQEIEWLSGENQNQDLDWLSEENLIRAYYSFFSVIASLKDRPFSPLRDVMEDYQYLAREAEKMIFNRFLPKRTLIREKNLFNAGDVDRKIIELGVKIIECVTLGKIREDDFLTEMFMRSMMFQTEFQNQLIVYAEKEKDVQLLHLHFKIMVEFRIKSQNQPNGCIPYDHILSLIRSALQRLSVS